MTFSIQLRSTSNVALQNVAVAAPPHITSGVQCGALSSPFTLAVGQEVTCRASYRFTHADLQSSDMVQSFAVSGPYLDLPAQRVVVKAAYGCDTCSACIAQFADACRQNLPLAGSPADVAKALGDFCVSTGRLETSCTALRAKISNSADGRLGLRAGAVCMQLAECAPGGTANSTTRPGSCDKPQAAANSLSGVRINGEQAVFVTLSSTSAHAATQSNHVVHAVQQLVLGSLANKGVCRCADIYRCVVCREHRCLHRARHQHWRPIARLQRCSR